MSAASQVLDPQTLALLRQRGPLAPQLLPMARNQAADLAALPGPVATPVTSMGGGMPSLPAPIAPQSAPNQLLTDVSKLNYLRNSGSGISQIGKIVDAQGNKTDAHPGLWKTVGKVGATVGDDVLKVVAPNVERIIPGTEGNNLRLQNLQQDNVANDIATQTGEANIRNLDLQPQLKLLGAQNTALKTQGYLQHVDDQGQHYEDQAGHWDDQTDNNLRNNGYVKDETDPTGQKIRPLRYEEMSEHQQAVEDLKHAQTEQAEANAALKKAQNDPTSPAFRLAKQRADAATLNANTAIGKLAVSQQNFGLRKQVVAGSLYGTDANGNALPGAVQIANDDGTTTTIGSRNAGNAIKQQKAVATFNDLNGSVKHLRNAIAAYESEGGDLSDPTLAAAAADPHSVVGKVVQGKLVTAGLSPAAITVLNAQRQTAEQAGILRQQTGGTAAEAGAQRILENVPKFGSDTNKSGYDKLLQQQQVLDRLAPGVSGVAGGLHLAQRPAANHPATGPAHSLKTAMALPFNAGKTEAQVTADLQAHGYRVVP